MKRSVSVSLIAVLAVALMYAFHFYAQMADCADNASKTILPAPQWKVGDWFELKVSRFAGLSVAYPTEKVEWNPPEIFRYEVAGEETICGYPCLVLKEKSRGLKGRYITTAMYLFRKSDMKLIAVRDNLRIDSISRNNDTDRWSIEYCGSPQTSGGIGFIPRFPVKKEIQTFPVAKFVNADGKHEMLNSKSESYEIPGMKLQGGCLDNIQLNKTTTEIVQAEYDKYICRWIPGQIWWTQCWEKNELPQGITGNKGKKNIPTYRASLYATSRDGVLDYPLPKAAKGGVILEKHRQCLP